MEIIIIGEIYIVMTTVEVHWLVIPNDGWDRAGLVLWGYVGGCG